MVIDGPSLNVFLRMRKLKVFTFVNRTMTLFPVILPQLSHAGCIVSIPVGCTWFNSRATEGILRAVIGCNCSCCLSFDYGIILWRKGKG